jgi:hypothetical protein
MFFEVVQHHLSNSGTFGAVGGDNNVIFGQRVPGKGKEV